MLLLTDKNDTYKYAAMSVFSHFYELNIFRWWKISMLAIGNEWNWAISGDLDTLLFHAHKENNTYFWRIEVGILAFRFQR